MFSTRSVMPTVASTASRAAPRRSERWVRLALPCDIPRSQPLSALITAIGSLWIARNSARAAPVGTRRPCSQLRNVATSIERSSENLAWLRPVAARIRARPRPVLRPCGGRDPSAGPRARVAAGECGDGRRAASRRCPRPSGRQSTPMAYLRQWRTFIGGVSREPAVAGDESISSLQVSYRAIRPAHPRTAR